MWHKPHLLTAVSDLLFLAGTAALLVAAVVVLPSILIARFRVPFYFGGTALLIVVGVALDTVAAMETHMISRSYEGFMKKGRIRARSGAVQGMTGDALSHDAVMKIALPMLGLLVLGLTIWAYKVFLVK